MEEKKEFLVKTEEFTGPLDLLLNLLENRQLPINRISLKKITEDYLIFLENYSIDEKDLADYLLILVKLLLIKASLLEIIEEENLTESLKLYQKVKKIRKIFSKVVQERKTMFGREIDLLELKFFLPRGVNKNVLQIYFRNFVNFYKKEAGYPLEKPKFLALKEAISQIKKHLRKSKSFVLQEITNSKSILISFFLALLFLYRESSFKLEQKELFSQIIIKNND